MAVANDTICDGLLAGVHDNVVVPAGAACEIAGARIKGSVKVFGALDVLSPTTIRGNIEGEPGHRYVRLHGGESLVVFGNVTIKGAVTGFEAGYLAGTQIRQNFQYEENDGFLVAWGGIIGGNLKSEKNVGGGGIFGNTVRGNLECQENVPPHAEAGNFVGGNTTCPK
jgi:hypothetical protein